MCNWVFVIGIDYREIESREINKEEMFAIFRSRRIFVDFFDLSKGEVIEPVEAVHISIFMLFHQLRRKISQIIGADGRHFPPSQAYPSRHLIPRDLV